MTTTYYGLWLSERKGWLFKGNGDLIYEPAPSLLFAHLNGPFLDERTKGEIRVAVIPERGGEPTEFIDPA